MSAVRCDDARGARVSSDDHNKNASRSINRRDLLSTRSIVEPARPPRRGSAATPVPLCLHMPGRGDATRNAYGRASEVIRTARGRLRGELAMPDVELGADS